MRITMKEIGRNFDGPPRGKNGVAQWFRISWPQAAQRTPHSLFTVIWRRVNAKGSNQIARDETR